MPRGGHVHLRIWGVKEETGGSVVNFIDFFEKLRNVGVVTADKIKTLNLLVENFSKQMVLDQEEVGLVRVVVSLTLMLIKLESVAEGFGRGLTWS